MTPRPTNRTRAGFLARTTVVVVVTGLVVAALAGCARGTTGGSGSPGDPGVDARLSAALGSVPHRVVAPLPASRLAPGLVPPTNRWFSGLVFGATPQPVFPLPLSFGLTGSGFAFGVPSVASGPDSITGSFTPAVTVDAGAHSSEVTAYDTASVTVEEKADDGSAIGSVVIAEGSPTVSFTAHRGVTLSLGQRFTPAGARVAGTVVAGSGYGLVSTGTLDQTSLRLAAGQTAVWFAAPKGSSVTELARRVSPLKSVSVAYSTSPTRVSTKLTYHAAGSTLIAAMPHQLADLRSPASCSPDGYASVYGAMSLCAGPTLAWSSPRLTASDSLDVGALSRSEKSLLADQVAKDVAATAAQPADSYYGGKALYRLANLLTLAHDVGTSSAASSAQKKLDAALEVWTDPTGCRTRTARCFVYDPDARGIVGLTPSFGSEQFNDHHFHYGYFLYAASVAAKYDPGLLPRITPVVNLLAADLATSGESTSFPDRRVFDAYAGHSWASGYAPFADGNDEESSSEAVDAWNGLALWAAATHNTPLETEATWMLSAEADSAKAYWTNFAAGEGVYRGYQHGIVGIDWGGKRDYATWFSADPGAKLGIQLIPMSPASTYLGGDPARITRNVDEATPAGFDVPLGDYLLMYSALGGRTSAAAALAVARGLPERFIDDGDSRSYLLAWIMVRERSGA
jgi:endoglucanase Acf2